MALADITRATAQHFAIDAQSGRELLLPAVMPIEYSLPREYPCLAKMQYWKYRKVISKIGGKYPAGEPKASALTRCKVYPVLLLQKTEL